MGDLEGVKLIAVSKLSSAAVRAAFEYWQRKCATGGLPASRTLDPLEVPRLLPHLLLKDVRRDPWDFRYRVVGTLVREHSRHDWTGKWMSEIDGQGSGSILFRVTQWVAERAEPAIYRPPYVMSARTGSSSTARLRSCRGSTPADEPTAFWSPRTS